MANEKTQLALATNSDAVPAYIKAGNRGNENVADALAIPRIKQLQKMSDEVDKHKADKYIPGAEPGMFMNSISGELLGDELYAISTNFKVVYNVWRTRESGGGIVGAGDTYADGQALIQEQVDQGNGKPEDFTNTETHSHLMLFKNPETGELSLPALFDFANSKLSVSKNWNTQIASKGGDRFAGLWKMSSVPVENRSGQSYLNLKIEWQGWVQEEDYKVAEALYEAHKS